MLEKVARFACRAWLATDYEAGELDLLVEQEWMDWMDIARAALQALREPDEGMLDVTDYVQGRDEYPLVIWRDMIDAALKE